MTPLLILAFASLLIPVAYLLTVSHGRFWRAATLWLVWPAIVFATWVAWEMLNRAPVPNSLRNALLGFSLLSAFLIIPWMIVSAAVISLALLVRRVFKSFGSQPVQTDRSEPFLSHPKPESSFEGECEESDAPELGAALRSTQTDGTIRVEFEPIEWYNGFWMSPPRVTDAVSGKIILDLWGQDWDAQVGYPGPRQSILRCSRFSGAAVTFLIDLEKQNYQILQLQNVKGPFLSAPIEQIAQGLEDACQSSVAASPACPEPNRQSAPAQSSWRPAITVSLGMLAMVVAIAFFAQCAESINPPSVSTIVVPDGGFRPAGK